jgi:hypothetical protein
VYLSLVTEAGSLFSSLLAVHTFQPFLTFWATLVLFIGKSCTADISSKHLWILSILAPPGMCLCCLD